MKLPENVKTIRTRFIAKYGLPHGSPETIDPIAREWSIQFAEQVRFETTDAQWGMKRADPGRPIGKDSLSRLEGGKLLTWDLFMGTGTGTPSLNLDPESEDITGQVFVPVQPIDHLGQVSTPGAPPLVVKTLADYFTFRDALMKIYAEELGRSIAGDPDAIVNWTYHWRDGNQTEAWIRARVRESAEWKTKHPAK